MPLPVCAEIRVRLHGEKRPLGADRSGEPGRLGVKSAFRDMKPEHAGSGSASLAVRAKRALDRGDAVVQAQRAARRPRA